MLFCRTSGSDATRSVVPVRYADKTVLALSIISFSKPNSGDGDDIFAAGITATVKMRSAERNAGKPGIEAFLRDSLFSLYICFKLFFSFFRFFSRFSSSIFFCCAFVFKNAA